MGPVEEKNNIYDEQKGIIGMVTLEAQGPVKETDFSSELELFLCLVNTIMPFFHWWYEDLIHDTTKSLMPPIVDVDSLQDVLCQQEKLPAAGLLSLQPGVWSSYFSG